MIEKSHVCTVPGCGAKFSRPNRLKGHVRKHNGERPFTCVEENCGKAFTHKWHLQRHILRSHKKIDETKVCPVKGCHRRLSNSDNLRKHHKNVHNVPKNFQYTCNICDKQFKKKHILRSHVYEHTGIAPFKCELCDFKFVGKTEFKKHKRNHKTYTCSCGIVFHRWTVYLKHRITKHQEKFECDTCHKKFICKRNYKVHLSVHNDKREVLECPMENCERLYYYKRNLTYHIKVFHLKHEVRKPPSKVTPKKNMKNENSAGKARRKDAGTLKRSTAVRLANVKVPYEAEKELIAGRQISVENEAELIDSSEQSGSENEKE